MTEHTVHDPGDRQIHEIAERIQEIVDDTLAIILPARLTDFEHRFLKDGDMAYGALNTELFSPVRQYLRDIGIKAKPRLPGSFQDSREWGNLDETHQQRWMWSELHRGSLVLGAIAVGSHHDHTRFRLPRSPEIIGLNSKTPARIVAELGGMKPAFPAAQAFREWYREYLKDQVK